MRTAWSNIELIGAPAYAISLGFDFCAEHESGIKTLQRGFRLDDKAGPGLVRRQSNASADHLRDAVWFKDYPKATKTMPAETRLMVDFSPSERSHDAFHSRRNGIANRGSSAISTAWSQSGFTIRAFTPEDRAFVEVLHQAILAGDLTIGHGPAEAFGRSPLTLAIPSRMPDELKQKIMDDDIAHENLRAAAADTGIAERLETAGIRTYALMPQWTEFFTSVVGREGKPSDDTEHPVIFFLNPERQAENNSGWFTVEELDQWIEGAGPILKAATPGEQEGPGT